MNEFHVDDLFSDALRAELVSQVEKESPAAKRRRTGVWLGSGVLAGAGLLGVGAAAAGLFFVPGGEKVTPLASPVTTTYTGTATVELDTPPQGSTGIQMELTCLTPPTPATCTADPCPPAPKTPSRTSTPRARPARFLSF
ncbi:hypothetical protein AB4Z38_21995 [Arthrobacter sp. 2RAF6]|uniref:hypothetical protein n=1 Tax=Arthrobacter sp. 2RAF6 TaxID=3233002 RepID=UPI003F92EB9F